MVTDVWVPDVGVPGERVPDVGVPDGSGVLQLGSDHNQLGLSR